LINRNGKGLRARYAHKGRWGIEKKKILQKELSDVAAECYRIGSLQRMALVRFMEKWIERGRPSDNRKLPTSLLWQQREGAAKRKRFG